MKAIGIILFILVSALLIFIIGFNVGMNYGEERVCNKCVSEAKEDPSIINLSEIKESPST